MFAHHYDAIVVGARCAGSTTAMLMARKGMRVLLVERDLPGTDTLSTHNLTRGAVSQLVRWGLADKLLKQGTPPVNRSTFHFGDTVLHLDLKPDNGVPGLLGTRRAILDATLVDAARAAGVSVHFQTSFQDVLKDDQDRVIGAIVTDRAGNSHNIKSSLVVGADGIRSKVARCVGAQIRKKALHTLGHIYSYYRGLPLGDNHCHFQNGAAASSTVTNDGACVVVASAKPDELRQLRREKGGQQVLEELASRANADFGALLRGSEMIEETRVFAGTHGFVRNSTGPGWALVGDAGYFRDPITAHGITDAFRDAELLADAAGSGHHALTMYESQRDEVTAQIWSITDRIAAFDMEMGSLQAAFRDLAQAMKVEQAWMSDRFDTRDLAA